jgi:hypothetical protein
MPALCIASQRLLCYYTLMVFARRYKLQGRNSALVMTIPRAVADEFKLTVESRLDVLLRDNKLIIDLPHPPKRGSNAARTASAPA